MGLFEQTSAEYGPVYLVRIESLILYYLYQIQRVLLRRST